MKGTLTTSETNVVPVDSSITSSSKNVREQHFPMKGTLGNEERSETSRASQGSFARGNLSIAKSSSATTEKDSSMVTSSSASSISSSASNSPMPPPVPTTSDVLTTAALCAAAAAAAASTSCMEGVNLAVAIEQNGDADSDTLAEQALIGLATISSASVTAPGSALDGSLYNKAQLDSTGESSQQVGDSAVFFSSALSSSINLAIASTPEVIDPCPTLRGQSRLSSSAPSPPQTHYSHQHPPSAKQRQALRRGKWTPEEEAYVARVIQDFNSGYLRAPPGTTLRTYLSEKLNCDPMRITKKFTGDACIGKVR